MCCICIASDALAVSKCLLPIHLGFQSVHAYGTLCLVSETFLQKQDVLLVCEGLDTVSVVYINHKEVGRSVNMFVRYAFDVKHALQVRIFIIRTV